MNGGTVHRDSEPLGTAGLLVPVGGLIVAAGTALAVVRYVGGSPAERGLEGALGAATTVQSGQPHSAVLGTKASQS